MPIVNRRFSGRFRGQSISPRAVLLQNVGPNIEPILAPLEAQLKSIADHGDTPPQPVSGHALIDTGASTTCVDAEAAQRAGMALVANGRIMAATHANELVPLFAGRLTIAQASNAVNSNRAFGLNLKDQGLIALIDRDLLANCVLVYNGLDGSFSLSL